MKYTAGSWKETDGACLRNFNEQAQIDSVNGALALRPQIEAIIDQIWEEGFDGIYFIGIGGTYASGMQVEVYMRGGQNFRYMLKMQQNFSRPEIKDLQKNL